MSTNWLESYQAAVLETDWTKMPDRVLVAESDIQARQRELSEDHGGTPEERQALADAANNLSVLRSDIVSWRDRQREQSSEA